jgi:hypothetical protein
MQMRFSKEKKKLIKGKMDHIMLNIPNMYKIAKCLVAL